MIGYLDDWDGLWGARFVWDGLYGAEIGWDVCWEMADIGRFNWVEFPDDVEVTKDWRAGWAGIEIPDGELRVFINCKR